ncbi:MAG: cyclic nucleotide-binding domain-containing protein [Pseudomonadota bacterium]
MHDVFAGLDEATLGAVATVSEPLAFEAGQTLVEEGDRARDLFVLLSGTAVAVRRGDDGREITLNTIEAGDCIGELAFLSGEPRRASVRASTRCEVILVPAARLEALPEPLPVLREVTGALASVAVKRAQGLSDRMLATLREQLAIKTLQTQFGHFLILTISLFLVSFALFYLVAEDYVSDVYDPRFAWQTVLLLAVPCVLVIWLMKIPARDLGLMREGLWRALGQSALVCAAIGVAFAAALYVFGGLSGLANAGRGVTPFFLAQYFVHCVIQEVGARGLLQNLFQKFLFDKSGHRSVLVGSVVFASLHITLGPFAVVITLIASILFGYMFLWQKNLAGVILLHFWLGTLWAATATL